MEIYLLTDGSVDPKLEIGFGAYLAFSGDFNNFDASNNQVKIRRFEKTSSTKLEMQTLLWALSEIQGQKIISYTDSQNIAGLFSRRERLVENDYYSGAGKLLHHHELYRKFFELTDSINIQFRLISGHKPSGGKSQIDRIFSIVDRASRKALRTHIKSIST